MRRNVIGVSLLVMTFALTAGLTGCSRPVGVDGSLTNHWALPPEPKVPVPMDHVCYNQQTEDPSEVAKWNAPVPCTEAHTVETVRVGTFAGADAERTTPPLSAGPERRRAYEDCSAYAKTFLGDDWRVGRLDLFLVLPSELNWDAGARWYRCDLMEYGDLKDMPVVTRTATLGGGLAAGSDLRLTCATVSGTGDSVDRVMPAPCGTPHNGEFAGVYDRPDGAYSADPTARSKSNLDGCRPVVAAFTGLANDGDLQYRTGQVASSFSKAAWELGNRGVRCYVWIPRTVSSSIKGAGPGGLPINHA